MKLLATLTLLLTLLALPAQESSQPEQTFYEMPTFTVTMRGSFMSVDGGPFLMLGPVTRFGTSMAFTSINGEKTMIVHHKQPGHGPHRTKFIIVDNFTGRVMHGDAFRVNGVDEP